MVARQWDLTKLEVGMLEILVDAELLRRCRQAPVVKSNKDMLTAKADARAYAAEFIAEKLKGMKRCKKK